MESTDLMSAESDKVLHRSGNRFSKKADLNPSNRFTSLFDIKIDLLKEKKQSTSS